MNYEIYHDSDKQNTFTMHMLRLYNIHTHKAPVNNAGELAIQNLYEGFDNMEQGCYYSVGVHPAYLQDHEVHFERVRQLASTPEVAAIGECGLDKLVDASMTLQADVLKQHILLGNKVHKPIIIHCVQAYEELLHVFRATPPQVPVIIHGFNKRGTIADKLTSKGYFLSFGAAILNDGSPAAGVLSNMPADRFFLETDNADVSIEAIYAKAAEIRDTPLESLILQIENNYKDVFAP